LQQECPCKDKTPYKNRKEVRGIAAHEMGHALNMKHVSPLGSWEYDKRVDVGGYPYPGESATMGCGAISFAEHRTIEQDDWAFLEYNFDSVENGFANSSFEYLQGPTQFWDWDSASGTTVQSRGSYSSDGNRHVKLGGRYGALMWQTVRIVDPGRGSQNPGTLTGRVNVKRAQVGTQGYVFFGLYGRQIDYPTTTSCDFDEDRDMRSPSYPSGGLLALQVTGYGYPGLYWEWPDTTEWTTVSSWEGVDVELRIYNYATADGNPLNLVDVRIDRARVRHTG